MTTRRRVWFASMVALAVCAESACSESAPQGTGKPGQKEAAVQRSTPPGMARIPAGCFAMGDGFREGVSNELPVHRVCLTRGFYVDVHEVTNAAYKACVDAKGCTAPGASTSEDRPAHYGGPGFDNLPVVYVNWHQATAYCAWAGKRLPSEAEWEYAARGGLAGKRYPWGDSVSCADANFDKIDASTPCETRGRLPNDAQPVGSFPANGYGLYDMAGNVWEWVNDGYSETYYSESPATDPPGVAPDYPVVRGGSSPGPAHLLRVSYRGNYAATLQNNLIGFRCARN